MFSFTKRGWVFLAVLAVVCAGFFAGCDLDPGESAKSVIPMPSELEGTWRSTFVEIYVITPDEFFSQYENDGIVSTSYAGVIKNIREDGTGAGYITIQYTECPDSAAIGKYYVIHYKGLTSTYAEFAGAYLASDPGFDNWGAGGRIDQADAEASYTKENGAYSWYSACEKQL